jgi:hypothetical protein
MYPGGPVRQLYARFNFILPVTDYEFDMNSDYDTVVLNTVHKKITGKNKFRHYKTFWTLQTNKRTPYFYTQSI